MSRFRASAAAASSLSLTSGSSVRTLAQHLREMFALRDNNDARKKIIDEYWVDVQSCVRDPLHTDLVERTPLMPPSYYIQACHSCPAPGNESRVAYTVPGDISEAATRDAVTAEMLDRVWAAWSAAEKALIDATEAVRADQADRKFDTAVSAEVKAAEVAAWSTYQTVGFEVVRQIVYRPVRTDIHDKAAAWITRYHADAARRNGTSTGIHRIWCLDHNAAGHFLPNGVKCHDAYMPCMICRKTAVPRNTRGTAPGAVLKSETDLNAYIGLGHFEQKPTAKPIARQSLSLHAMQE